MTRRPGQWGQLILGCGTFLGAASLGRAEVYVQSFPIATGQRPVSQEGGVEPQWHPDGRTLYYYTFAGQYMAVDITTEPTFSLSSVPRLLFENRDYREWDIHPDGSRFVVVANQGGVGQDDDPERTNVYLVTNWFTELRQRMPN